MSSYPPSLPPFLYQEGGLYYSTQYRPGTEVTGWYNYQFAINEGFWIMKTSDKIVAFVTCVTPGLDSPPLNGETWAGDKLVEVVGFYRPPSVLSFE